MTAKAERLLLACNCKVNRKNRISRIQPTTRKCRDCPASFETTEPRRRLCDFCRWLHKRTIGNRASRRWYASLDAEGRQRIYDRTNAYQKRNRLKIAQRRPSRARKAA